MSKKTATATAPKAEMFDKGGVGKKQCPGCKKYFKGPTRKECPGCGFKFPASKPREKSKGGNILGGFAIVRAANEFAHARGGIDQAKAQLGELKALIQAAGGIEGAEAALDELEKIADLNKKK
jgi:hypothetical protein